MVNKVERIAKKLVAFTQTIHINENGVEVPIEIDDIIVVLSSQPVDGSDAIVASSTRPSIYSLQEVQECLKAGRYKFEDRQDGKANPEEIGIGEQEAIDVICSLTYADYDRKGNFDADIYKKFGYVRERTKTPIDLYIKFKLEKGRGGKKVLVISFHREGCY